MDTTKIDTISQKIENKHLRKIKNSIKLYAQMSITMAVICGGCVVFTWLFMSPEIRGQWPVLVLVIATLACAVWLAVKSIQEAIHYRRIDKSKE